MTAVQAERAASALVPRMRKTDFDCEATHFLEKYCPEALKRPMPVPIEEIANRMGLTIIRTRITEDFSVFGMMCFTRGKVDYFDKDYGGYAEMVVKEGTMLIDPDVRAERNKGCENNTISHECLHWERHRQYHQFLSSIGEMSVAMRCSTAAKAEWQNKTDEDWMEWQANGIAPRILMPKQTVRPKILSLSDRYDYLRSQGNEYPPYECSQEELILAISEHASVHCTDKQIWIRDRLADFYKVSKQSAGIRMIELNFASQDTFPRFIPNREYDY